jgi:allantoate deiminase
MSLGAEIVRRADELALCSADGPNCLTRLYLTEAHRAAAVLVSDWMRQAGMAVHVDAAGTVVGRLEGVGAPGAPALLLGSHIDTVRNAGKYDGNLGVLAAISVVGELVRLGRALPYPVEILAFGDEEGVRFPVTLTSSRAIAGLFAPEALEARDADGITLRQALRRFGGDPDALPALARRHEDVAGYVEVHIEQGPVLETHDLPVGIVTAISGASRLMVNLEGFAGHAGTVPMALRRDAMAAAAEMVLALEALALERPDIVATVGRIAVAPGAVNVIAGSAEFSVDLRSPSDAARRNAVAEMRLRFREIGLRRGVDVVLRSLYEENAATCDPALMDGLARAVAAEGIAVQRLPSGAGHDGLAMSALCPFAMLFVRCKGGISHNPAEAVAEGDVSVAAAVLRRFLEDFRPG